MSAPILDAESSLTNRYQTTVPAPVRAALGLEKGDKIQYTILSGGQAVISRASAPVEDPILEGFLNFISNDIQSNPDHIQPLSNALKDRIQSLTTDVEINLDALLDDEDD